MFGSTYAMGIGSETPARDSSKRGWSSPIATISLLCLTATAVYFMRTAMHSAGFDERFEAIIRARAFPERPGHLLRADFTGIEGVDFGLRFLVGAFTPGAEGFTKEIQLQQAYFLLSFYPLLTIHAVEQGRKGTGILWTIISIVNSMLYQTIGGAIIIPIYYTLLLHQSSKTSRDDNTFTIPTAYAKALPPALILIYLIPTIAMYTPFPDVQSAIHQGIVAFWQVTPIIVHIALALVSLVSSSKSGSTSNSEQGSIGFAYGVSVLSAAAVHVALLYSCFLSPEPLSLTKVLLPSVDQVHGQPSETLMYIFQVDYLVIIMAAVIVAIFGLIDLGAKGRSDVTLLQWLVIFMVGSVAVGPAAIVGGVWWYREAALRSHQKLKLR